MRRLAALVFFLALVAGAASIGDIVVKDRVQSAMAGRIDSQLPGSHATVHIRSFPFVGRLALSGTVPGLSATVVDVAAGDVTFSSIHLSVEDLRVDRHQLRHGEVQPLSIRSGQAVAEISQATVGSLAHLPLVLGDGRVSADGVDASAQLAVSAGQVTVTVAGLPAFTVDVPVLGVLPCVDAAQIVPGALRLSCQLHALPPVLAGATFHF